MGEQDDSQEEENEVGTHEETLPNTEESESEKEETEFLDDEDYQPETKVKVELESRGKPSRRRQPPGYLSDYLTDLMNEDVHDRVKPAFIISEEEDCNKAPRSRKETTEVEQSPSTSTTVEDKCTRSGRRANYIMNRKRKTKPFLELSQRQQKRRLQSELSLKVNDGDKTLDEIRPITSDSLPTTIVDHNAVFLNTDVLNAESLTTNSNKKSLNTMAFAVVRFVKEECSFSEIPTSWISEDKLYCYWPNQKNYGQLMKKNVLPSMDWLKEPIEIEGYYDTLDKARKVAEDPNYTSNEEFEKRKPQPRRWLNFEASDEDTNESVDQPPQLKKNFKTKTTAQPTSNNSEDARSPASSDIIGCYQIENSCLTKITQSEKIGTGSSVASGEQEKEKYGCVSEKLDKIYKVQMENNYYLKAIYKKLNRLEVEDKKKNVHDAEVFANTFPFEEVQQIIDFEENLVSTNKEALTFYINRIGGKSYKDNIHRCLRTIYTNNVARFCSWLGQRGNFKVKNTKIMSAIKDVMTSTYSSLTESEFEVIVSEWFRLASSRMKAKKPQI
ncbi:hypothetical protein RN001_002445 [Aquatica leii]|uniref:DUF4806 domain-containing protein n=1 Tax=Aquatica leii TaxID=1421715 RepID=A0AAN7Q5B5_9COLE|nr:hypothetical protein RN001_002445 [Aquatica leii]